MRCSCQRISALLIIEDIVKFGIAIILSLDICLHVVLFISPFIHYLCYS